LCLVLVVGCLLFFGLGFPAVLVFGFE